MTDVTTDTEPNYRLKFRMAKGRDYSFPKWVTEEDLTALGANILSEHAHAMEVLYSYEIPEREERMAELRVLQREKVVEKAQAWVAKVKEAQPLMDFFSPAVESLLQQAYLTGWRDAPLGPRAIRP